MAIVELRGVAVHGAGGGLIGVDLALAPGECVALLGEETSGARAVLRVVAGLDQVARGDVLIGGVRVNGLGSAQREVAIVSGTGGLYPHLSVAENIRFPLGQRRFRRREHEGRVREAAALAGIDGLERRPGALGPLERYRAALARALVRRPAVLVLDDPFAMLGGGVRIGEALRLARLRRDLGLAVLVATEDADLAGMLGERVVVMAGGAVAQEGTMAAVRAAPASVLVAAAAGGMNLVAGSLMGGTFVARGVMVRGLVGPDAPVSLGFWPEDGALLPPGEGEIRGEVLQMEAHGNGALALVAAGGGRIAVRAPADLWLPAGAAVSVAVPPALCHLFGAETGRRLAGAPPVQAAP